MKKRIKAELFSMLIKIAVFALIAWTLLFGAFGIFRINDDAMTPSCKDGDIVLMHDLYPSTAAAVEKLVPKLRKKGFQLVTVEELFYYKGIDAKGGKVYFSGR